MGSSLIRDMSDHVSCSGIRARTGQKPVIVGQGGLCLSGVEPLTDMLIKTHKPPMVIIHAGANDVGSLEGWYWKEALKNILKNLKEKHPTVRFVWSDMLPRLSYRNHDTQAAEKKRRRYQRVARALFGGPWVSHPDIQTNREFLRWDQIHLSFEGNRQFYYDFENFILEWEQGRV